MARVLNKVESTNTQQHFVAPPTQWLSNQNKHNDKKLEIISPSPLVSLA